MTPSLSASASSSQTEGSKYHHAQGNYFPQPIVTDGGAYRYKLVDGVPVECTAEEIAQQEAENQPEPSTPDTEPYPSSISVQPSMSAKNAEELTAVMYPLESIFTYTMYVFLNSMFRPPLKVCRNF